MLHTKTKIDFATMPLDELVKHVFPFYTRIDKPTKIPPPPPPPPPPKPHVMPMAPPPITDLKNMQPGETYSRGELIKASELDSNTTFHTTSLIPSQCQLEVPISNKKSKLCSFIHTHHGYSVKFENVNISNGKVGPNKVEFIELNDENGNHETLVIWQQFNFRLFVLHAKPFDPNSFIFEHNNISRLTFSSEFMPYKLVPLCLPAANPACNSPSSTAHPRVSSLPSVRCET